MLAAVLAVTILGACGDDGGSSDESASGEPVFPMTVTNCGQDVVIAERPAKVLTIGHESLEAIVAAGGADRISVRAGETAPEPYIGQVKAEQLSGGDPSGEEIIGTGVDMVVSYGLFDVDPQTLKDAGIASLVVSGLCGQHGGGVGEGASFEGVLQDIELFGTIFGTEDVATKSVADLQARLDRIKGEFVGKNWTAAAGGFYQNNLSLAGGLSMANQILEHLGIANVFGQQETDFDAGSVEELVDLDPDVFAVYFYEPDETAATARQTFLGLPGANDMKALTGDRIVTYRYVYSQASPSAVSGAEAIAAALRGK